jgi:voltage-gated potassium channel
LTHVSAEASLDVSRPPGRLAAWLDRSSHAWQARLARRIEAALILAGLLLMLIVTARDVSDKERLAASSALIAIMVVFVVDALARLALGMPFAAALKLERPRTEASGPLGIASVAFDALTVLPMAIAAPFYWTRGGAPLLASLWLLRFARYSNGARVLSRVLMRERQPILGVLLLFAIVLLGGAILGYLAEREAQPQVFTSVGATLWWTITTLTTTGYGDMTPVTFVGRLIGGGVMIGGVVTISLLAGILATGFSAELKRGEFLRNWDLVSKVPFLANAGAGTIADVAALLRPRDLPGRFVVMRRGQAGDCMYFVVAGEVEILIEPKPVRLGAGSFFGEMALLSGAPRNATIVTTRPTQLLALDIADFRGLAASRPELTDLIRREAERRLGATRG